MVFNKWCPSFVCFEFFKGFYELTIFFLYLFYGDLGVGVFIVDEVFQFVDVGAGVHDDNSPKKLIYPPSHANSMPLNTLLTSRTKQNKKTPSLSLISYYIDLTITYSLVFSDNPPTKMI